MSDEYEVDVYMEPVDPAETAPYPRGLALDLVLEVAPLKDILNSYELKPEQFKKILTNPAFRKEYETHSEAMKTEGWSFRKKCQAQAELYLNLVFRLANSDMTPAAVRADLIKSTVKWAGLDTPAPNHQNTPEALLPKMAEQLKEMSDGELEMRVMSLVMRKSKAQPASVDVTPTGITYDA